ncbi:MAG: hypothetical protein WDO13_08075 [Verrucomicrobiota bacterium]
MSHRFQPEHPGPATPEWIPPDLLNHDGTEPECVGLAASAREVYASIYSQNLIQVLDPESGPADPHPGVSTPARTGARSARQSRRSLVRSRSGATGPPLRPRAGRGPSGHHLETGRPSRNRGRRHGPDRGHRRRHEPAGQALHRRRPSGRHRGRAGGRPWLGTYDPQAFLSPSQIVADAKGALVVAESAVPKIFDRFDLATGKNLGRWFGYPGYGVSNIPDIDDPADLLLSLRTARLRPGHGPGGGRNGYPDAYWDYSKVALDGPGKGYFMNLPYVETLRNGRKYSWKTPARIMSASSKAISFFRSGASGSTPPQRPLPQRHRRTLRRNLDRPERRPQDRSRRTHQAHGNRRPAGAEQRHGPVLAVLDADGTAYLTAQDNSIIKIPSDGFDPNGAILWNPAKATRAIPHIVPSLFDTMGSGPRQGLAGVRTDSQGNLYACVTATVPALTPALTDRITHAYPGLDRSFWWTYADTALEKRLHEGLGHTSESNAVKFVKFAPDGKPLWIAGRKATAHPTRASFITSGQRPVSSATITSPARASGDRSISTPPTAFTSTRS